MLEINIKELRNNLKDYIGKDVAITKHGKVVAYLTKTLKEEPNKEIKNTEVNRFNRFETCPKHGGFKKTCGCT